jgi:DNA-binding transcriptional ArsR family regulator
MARLDTYEIKDVETLEVLNDPTRMRILHLFQEPRSVRELAEALDVPVTRLYYHVNLLEEKGLIEVVETRKVGAMTQRIFQTIADGFRPGQELIDSINDNRKAAGLAVAAIFDGARLDAEAALVRHFESEDTEKVQGSLGRTFVSLTPERLEYVTERITALLEEIDAQDEGTDDAQIYSFTYALFPAVGPFKEGRR